MTDLRLLHIVNSVLTPTCTVDNLMEDYKGCFEGLGKMKSKTAKLIVDNSVKKLAQKYHRLPFHIRDQVEAELKNLKELGIIEKAEGPTPWVSPIVAPKTGIGIQCMCRSI